MRRAAAVLEGVYEGIAEEGLIGRTEREVAWRVLERFHEAGAEGPSFDSIVASGAAGALPHAEPRDELIGPGTLVTMDIGCVFDGYCSDCTRTFATEGDAAARSWPPRTTSACRRSWPRSRPSARTPAERRSTRWRAT